MSQLIHAPMVVREMDWVSHVWPSDLPEDRCSIFSTFDHVILSLEFIIIICNIKENSC